MVRQLLLHLKENIRTFKCNEMPYLDSTNALLPKQLYVLVESEYNAQ